MAKASHLPKEKVIVGSGTKTDDFAAKVFAKSDYPKTLKENIKLFLNLFINFFC
ncbi:MAG: hypothetical protein WDO71_05180 [Bacteroidota bacterium]